ncbi:TerD domain-containing protein [Streptomyces puniciscabiei]|uniref:TerD domain-containing protein n=1 Tax=Streptomyces puniciscabiei TaxID=164348 RepID=A0A542ULC7_9ACTN|nr:TerD family protein [Streptomyces puniciscabiei]TQK99855.1 TerD domain-containing protein [Streptomyces puniciscabiei]
MTAELVRGQNHPLSQVRLTIRISAGVPVLAGATLGDENGTVHGPQWVAHPGAPALPGVQVPRKAATGHRVAVDLDALPEAVHRVDVFLALPTGPGTPLRFGAVAAPQATVEGLDGTELACYTLTGLDRETAVLALELYRRQGVWKVRAVGQGYAAGLTALLADQGLREAADVATAAHAAAHGEAATAGGAVADGDAVAAGEAAAHDDVVAAGEAVAHSEAVAHGPSRPLPTPSSAPPAHETPARAPQDTFTAPQPEPSASAARVTPTAGPYDTDAPEPQDTPASGTPGPTPSRAPRQPEPTPPYEAENPHDTQTSGAASRDRGTRVDYTHPGRRPHGTPPPAAPAAGDDRPAQPVAGDAVGWSMEERLYNQVWGMFEDLARTTAAYRSAVDFADSRLEKELDQVLTDPRGRLGTAGDAAREAAHARRTQLVDQARAVLDRDIAQLTAECEVVEPALPPACARWDNPVWHGYRVPTEPPMALRLGDLHLPESLSLRIPLLVRMPLERGLWLDSGPAASGGFPDSAELRRLAMEAAVALAARLLAVHPAGDFTVQVIDPAATGAAVFAPLTRTGVLAAPPATGAAGVTELLERLTRRVDLVQMALRGGAPEALPADVDPARQLLIVNDFPHGFDDRAVTRLRYLADEGPGVGVHLLLVADREDAAAYGPLLDPLWRSLMRLTPVPDDHFADPWVGHAWTYEPSLVPTGSRIVHQVLTEVARALTKRS